MGSVKLYLKLGDMWGRNFSTWHKCYRSEIKSLSGVSGPSQSAIVLLLTRWTCAFYRISFYKAETICSTKLRGSYSRSVFFYLL